MIFWRILDSKLYPIQEVTELGFSSSEGLVIPDNYLSSQNFTVMRTCHGIGDWGIISAMPRLLKEKYPNCKVYLPSPKLLKKIFRGLEHNWSAWEDPFTNVKAIFDNNPYVDGYKDFIQGEIFHDHYRIYDTNNPDIPLLEQILNFWQFNEDERKNSQPEIYWSEDEKKLGDHIINKHVGDSEFGTLLTTKRIQPNDPDKILEILHKNPIPYFYFTHKPINQTPFKDINKILDLRHIDIRIQLYIKSKAKLNVGNQCGVNHMVVRHSNVYEVQRQFPLGGNFVKGEIYL